MLHQPDNYRLYYRQNGKVTGKPEDILTGKCAVCHLVVEVERLNAQPPSGPSASGKRIGDWDDLWSCECPHCTAESKRKFPDRLAHTGPRVFLMEKKISLPPPISH